MLVVHVSCLAFPSHHLAVDSEHSCLSPVCSALPLMHDSEIKQSFTSIEHSRWWRRSYHLPNTCLAVIFADNCAKIVGPSHAESTQGDVEVPVAFYKALAHRGGAMPKESSVFSVRCVVDGVHQPPHQALCVMIVQLAVFIPHFLAVLWFELTQACSHSASFLDSLSNTTMLSIGPMPLSLAVSLRTHTERVIELERPGV